MKKRINFTDLIEPYSKKDLAAEFGYSYAYFDDITNKPQKAKIFFNKKLQAEKLEKITGYKIEDIDFDR